MNLPADPLPDASNFPDAHAARRVDAHLSDALSNDAPYLLKTAQATLAAPERRRFAQQICTLGALSMLSGCTLTDGHSIERMLTRMSRFNDHVQAWLFDPLRLAQTYSESRMTRPFPFNAFYSEDQAPVVATDSYRLKVSGRVYDTHAWTLPALYALPYTDQVTRHICVEGWSAIGKWGGVRFSEFLHRIGADVHAKYVGFRCADGYYTSIDMPTALHPQTLLAFTYDGKILPRQYGYPMKLRMPTKLGYKNPKHIVELFVTNEYSGGYWEDQGYNWFGGS